MEYPAAKQGNFTNQPSSDEPTFIVDQPVPNRPWIPNPHIDFREQDQDKINQYQIASQNSMADPCGNDILSLQSLLPSQIKSLALKRHQTQSDEYRRPVAVLDLLALHSPTNYHAPLIAVAMLHGNLSIG